MPKRTRSERRESKPLSDCLEQIRSALDKQDWDNAKRLGEKALRKLPSLSYSPFEEHLLYCHLGFACFSLAEYARSLDAFYKAYLTASKHNLEQVRVAYASFKMGLNFLVMMHINQALSQFHKVEQYCQKLTSYTFPMNKEMYVSTLINLAYCYLYKNDLGKAGQIIEQKLSPSLLSPSGEIYFMDYMHIKGEYLMSIKDYRQARQSFQISLKACEQADFPRGILEAKIHLAAIDLLENQLDSAFRILPDIMKEALCLKLNNLACEAGFLLCKCYSLKGLSRKASSIENRIKPVLSKLDTIWLYEKTREFDRLYQQLQGKTKHESRFIPQILVQTLDDRYENSVNKYTIVGNSPSMQEIYHLIEKISPTDMPVLIQGETGTGKELIANAIHNNSLRINKSYLPFNCGVLPETLVESTLFGHAKGAFTGAIEDKKGYIELASGGTLFIDEISNMSPSMQQKLLRVMEEKLLWRVGGQKPIPVDTRFVFASNQTIEQMVKQKLFREDLFYRINTIIINLPPLRDRGDDIPILAQHFLRKCSLSRKEIPERSEVPTNVGADISPSALALFTAYPWPGNIRELENEIKRICALYPDVNVIEESMLSNPIRSYINMNQSAIKSDSPLKELRNEIEKSIIIEVLKKNNGNITKAACQLNSDRSTLSKKIKQLKITISNVTKR
ncbi:MAG: sigma-54-dependent Fis family transcriptional regulator [Planctomycetes bacterium]|nr:sigma-54-dependent Fis family transcriptional regulator [Planctomycetota bacterium]